MLLYISKGNGNFSELPHTLNKYGGNIVVAYPGEGPEGTRPPLFLDQTEARGAEKNIFGDRPPPPLISRRGSATVLMYVLFKVAKKPW